MSEKAFFPIREWPEGERPREKLLRDGEHRLTGAELLAILLDSGTPGASSLDLARRLLSEYGSLGGVARVPADSLKKIRGIGTAKICRIKAAAEMGCRMAEERSASPGTVIGSPGDIARLFQPRMRGLRREVFKTLCLDSQNRVIRVVEVEEGTVNYASPILREVFHRALENYASSIVCVHNHPSGNPAPSREDKSFTESLVAAGKVLQVAVLDHVIIGSPGYFSFADEGLIGRD